MKHRFLRRCDHAPGVLTPKTRPPSISSAQSSPPCATGSPGRPASTGHRHTCRTIRGKGTPPSGRPPRADLIAVCLVHPDTAAYLHGHQLGYTGKGWLHCETDKIAPE